MRKAKAKPDIDKIFDDGKVIDRALKKAAREARLFHKRLGNPIADWPDGKVILVQPKDIKV